MVRPLYLSLALPVLALCVSPLAVRAFDAPNPCAQQTDPPPSHQASVRLWSGDVQNDGDARAVVFRGSVNVPGAEWLRLQFDELLLAGDPAGDDASILRITSVKDGYSQTMNAEHVEQWSNTSAYFNGDEVTVEIIAHPGTGVNRIRIIEATAGEPPSQPDTICDGTDNRALSSDPRSARHMPEGCTAWLHDDLNKTFMMAGHCGGSAGDVEQFNVPLSNANGSVNHPPPADQYPVDGPSVQFTNGGVGNDWCYFGTLPNSNTGLSAFQVQGQAYVKASSAPAVANPPQPIRITGYGTVGSPVSPTWNQVQKTHSGPYFQLTGTTVRYRTDTTGGNSGSAVQNDANGTIIGIHTHGGCGNGSGSNAGTAIQHTGLQAALAAPRSICLTGRAPVSPPLFCSGDMNNNFGTANTTSGLFGKVSEIATVMQGLAYDRNAGVFYGTSSSGRLYRVTPAGVATNVAAISGTTQVINGLGFNPNSNTLYGIAQANGQLFSIHTTTGVATPIGSAGGNTVGALDYNPANSTLYGLDDSAGASKLIRVSTADGSQTLIGALGAGIADCNGLAYNDRDGQLYTINAATEQLLRINPATGVATLVGATNGLFGAGYGMAVELLAPGISVSPDALAIINGDHTGGSVADLLTSNDVRVVVFKKKPSRLPPVQIQVDGTCPAGTTSASRIDVTVETRSLVAGTTTTIQAFNFVDGVWVTIDTFSVGTTDVTRMPAITSNATRFIEPGTRRVRIRIGHDHASPGLSGQTDIVKWVVTP